MTDQLNVRTKQPSEKRTLTFDFTSKLATGDTVSGLTSVTSALTLGTPTLSSGIVSVQVSAGSSGQSYIVTARVTTTLGDTLELDAVISVGPALSIPTVRKQPNEVRTLPFDFASKLPQGDTVASITSVTATGLTVVAQSLSGSIVKVRLSGGTAALSPYTATVIATTTQGDILALDSTVVVEEDFN